MYCSSFSPLCSTKQKSWAKTHKHAFTLHTHRLDKIRSNYREMESMTSFCCRAVCFSVTMCTNTFTHLHIDKGHWTLHTEHSDRATFKAPFAPVYNTQPTSVRETACGNNLPIQDAVTIWNPISLLRDWMITSNSTQSRKKYSPPWSSHY